MDDWIFSPKSASSQKNLEPIFDQHDILSNNHQWYSTYHARPTYCNVCREALPGVTSHGLSCEVCKCKVHKRCAAKAISNCKWTTLASIGKDIIENKDGSIVMPHQWMEGNLPVASVCSECRKTCGSVLRLQDWRCLWCRATVHSSCRSAMPEQCPIGPAKLSVVPPTSVHSIGIDDALDIVCPKGSFSPLLVFVNSKSGDNQGIKFLRRFKQLLNPAQVFDLISTGPSLGLRLFRHFDTFRILVCSGDGSVGWVLSEIDRFNMHKQCQVAVLPLGTGNDLARVLGWGSSCEDDAHLPQVLERYESASTKMLDRWSIMVFEKSVSMKSSEMLLTSDQEAMLSGLVTSTIENLDLIVETDDTCILLSAVRILSENIDELSDTFCKNRKDDEQLIMKCDILRHKLNMLVDALRVKEISDYLDDDAFEPIRKINTPEGKDSNMGSICNMEKTEKDQINCKERIDSIKLRPIEKTNLQCRANSVKRAIYNVVEHSEPGRPKRYERKLSINPFETMKMKNVFHESISPLTIPPINIISPSNSTAQLLCLSPLPDLVDDNTLCTLSLPVPSQFADNVPHLSVPENIQEFNENIKYQPAIDHSDIRTPYLLDLNSKTHVERLDSLSVPILAKEEVFDELCDFHHSENFCRNSKIGLELQKDDFSNQEHASFQITRVFASANEPSLTERENDEGMTIIANCGNKSQSETITVENTNKEVTAKNLDAYHSTPLSSIMQNLMLDSIAHIDSPDTTDEIEESPGGTSLVGKSGSFIAPYSDDDIIESPCADIVPNKNITSRQSFPLIQKPCKHSIEKKNQQFGFENIVFEIDNRCDDQKIKEPPKYCTLAKFVQGSEFENIASSNRFFSESLNLGMNETEISQDFNTTKTHQSTSDILKGEPVKQILPHQNKKNNNPITEDAKRITFDDSCKKESLDDDFSDYSQINLIARVPPVIKGNNAELLVHEPNDLRRHSSHATSLSPREYQSDNEKYRRHSGYNTKNLSFDPEHIRFLNCSPAATRRISCGSLFKLNEGFTIPTLKTSKTNISTDSSGLEQGSGKEKDEKTPNIDDERKKLPIINPFVRLPSWPNINNGSGFISKCLLANADTLCAAVSPLMDPDETLLEGYHEKCVMNNYFGIGIDAKISLDFHNKREEHPEQCRSRARNYMWYGVLGSKQLVQKSYKNFEQRVQLECDGQRIPLPSLQGIVILNIPSFMGGTNFWGGTRKDDIFLAPSFDDRILEVVAVFGSAQMAASRLINLQHHRIAQCQSVQINILGNEEVPIQVDGEAWLQPPGMIRILHKNRVQMLCRNKHLEMSLKQWEEKKRQHSISIQMDQSLTSLDQGSTVLDDNLSEHECHVLLNLIEAICSLVKWVKFLIISHPSLRRDLYIVANRASDALESIHPNGTLLEGPILRIKLVEVIDSSRHLYSDTCSFLRDRGPSLILREDLEAKLSAALANIEMELKKCSVLKCIDGKIRAYFNDAIPHGDLEARKKPFWVRLRSGSAGYKQPLRPTTNTRDAVCNWSVYEVVTWLETMQLSEYVDTFVKNDIRGKELLSLSRRDLKDLGVIKVGHIKRILEAIKDLCKH